MPLIAHQHRTGWPKMLKHVFSHDERWWELFGGITAWAGWWRKLHAAGLVPAPAGLPTNLDEGVQQLVYDIYDLWLREAEAAMDQALAAGRVYGSPTDRRAYIGDRGVVTVAAQGYLVTAFRVAARARDTDAVRVAFAVRQFENKQANGRI